MKQLSLSTFNKKKLSVSIFNNLMTTAHEIAQINPLGLPDLVKAILRPLQAEHIYFVAERDPHNAPPAIDRYNFFMRDQPWRLSWVYGDGAYAEGERINPEPFRVRLGKDLVLPTCWNRSRFEGALASIGSQKTTAWTDRTWRADSNHNVLIWLPWGIAFVLGGNHSISAGILAGEGEVEATEVYDLGQVIDQVRCDGKVYVRIDNGEVIARVTDVRRAAVFEIGRIMRDNGISAFPEALRQGQLETLVATRNLTIR